MRTPEEILAQCQLSESFFRFDVDALTEFLTFDQARPLFKDEALRTGWKSEPITREAVLAKMRDYMEFAWDKVENHRGLSASRSIEKMEAWIWLLGDDDAARLVAATYYTNYGAPKLACICERYGFPIPDDEGIRRMIRSQPCGLTGRDCGCSDLLEEESDEAES